MSYLFIGGAPKSATTSLFQYLADHPEVCPANRKETYFFAREFDIANVCQVGDTRDAFESYFAHCGASSGLRLEATPYTLYAEGAPREIVTLLPESSMLFVLRDPVERLVSDYFFHVQNEHPSANGSFDEFIEWQKWMRGNIPGLIEQGCYFKYLSQFFSIFGDDRVHIVFFEELVVNPGAELRRICELLEIDEAFYEDYNFHRRNKTMSVRNYWLNNIVRFKVEPYVSKVRTNLIKRPKMYGLFENIVGVGQTAYRTINDSRQENKEPIEEEMLNDLVKYYSPYNEALAEVLDRQLPWKSF